MQTTLPIIDRPLDNTALTMYMTCPKKYKYGMVDHRRQSGPPSPPIAYGTTWHKFMEAHYKTNGDRDVVFKEGAKSWEQHDKQDDHRTFERCWMEYQNYCERYGLPSEEDAKTIGYPDAPAVEISANVQFPGISHPYAGKIDRIIELSGQYYVEDHKTTSRLGSYYFKEFELSNQMMGYVNIAEMLIPSVKIAGVRINAHAVYKRESKFERQIISFSQDRLEDWRANYAHWVEKLTESYSRDEWPHNFSACPTRYGVCGYAGVCSMPPRLRERVLEQDFELNPWNPLEADEESEAAE